MSCSLTVAREALASVTVAREPLSAMAALPAGTPAPITSLCANGTGTPDSSWKGYLCGRGRRAAAAAGRRAPGAPRAALPSVTVLAVLNDGSASIGGSSRLASGGGGAAPGLFLPGYTALLHNFINEHFDDLTLSPPVSAAGTGEPVLALCRLARPTLRPTLCPALHGSVYALLLATAATAVAHCHLSYRVVPRARLFPAVRCACTSLCCCHTRDEYVCLIFAQSTK